MPSSAVLFGSAGGPPDWVSCICLTSHPAALHAELFRWNSLHASDERHCPTSPEPQTPPTFAPSSSASNPEALPHLHLRDLIAELLESAASDRISRQQGQQVRNQLWGQVFKKTWRALPCLHTWERTVCTCQRGLEERGAWHLHIASSQRSRDVIFSHASFSAASPEPEPPALLSKTPSVFGFDNCKSHTLLNMFQKQVPPSSVVAPPSLHAEFVRLLHLL